MFSLDTPWYLGLGGLGGSRGLTIIAHEINHALCKRPMLLDEQRNVSTLLKHPDFKRQFEDRRQCFINHYSSDKFQTETEVDEENEENYDYSSDSTAYREEKKNQRKLKLLKVHPYL